MKVSRSSIAAIAISRSLNCVHQKRSDVSKSAGALHVFNYGLENASIQPTGLFSRIDLALPDDLVQNSYSYRRNMKAKSGQRGDADKQAKIYSLLTKVQV